MIWRSRVLVLVVRVEQGSVTGSGEWVEARNPRVCAYIRSVKLQKRRVCTSAGN